MLENALERLPEDHQLLLHSDQGWHYQMEGIVKDFNQEELYKVCLVKETVTITLLWRTSLGL